MFTPSNMLLNSLREQPRDMYDIVGALMGYINADPEFQTDDFEQAIRYVLNQGISESELFAPFDEELEFRTDESVWSEEYYSYARMYLKDNFCRKRITHVKAVAEKLYPRKKVSDMSWQKPASAIPMRRDYEGTASCKNNGLFRENDIKCHAGLEDCVHFKWMNDKNGKGIGCCYLRYNRKMARKAGKAGDNAQGRKR